MELWVRSQDKMNLVKIKQINIDYQNNKQIIANYEPEQYENSSCFYELLGTYKTKERALEILDEIQNLMLKGAFAKKENGLGEVLDYIPNNLIIYQMPKE